MRICPITYDKIETSQKYSKKGLHQLSPALSSLKDFPYTAEEQRQEAEAHSSKLSIQGIQPKLSVALNVKDTTFEVIDHNGRYILKPQVERHKHLPENEGLTMRLAEMAGIEVPVQGLVYSKDGSLTYFIRRFDRRGQKEKLHVEDFAQLSGESRATKYDSSMERVAEIIDKHCSFPAIERVKLFRRTLFSFLVGNEDMHLKNFSIIVRNDKVELTPGYDLVNTTIVLTAPKEELALPLKGKKSKITRNDLIKYFAIERLRISERVCKSILDDFKACLPKWQELIGRSFLPKEDQERYTTILKERSLRLELIKLDSFKSDTNLCAD